MQIFSRMKPLKVASDELLHLDFMRFVASIGIVFHHSHEFFAPQAIRAAVMDRTAGFALFVDLFFLISGFVISHVYLRKVGTLGQTGRFLQRRVARLIPLHWIVLPLTIAVWAVALRFGKAGHAPSFEPSCIVSNALLLHGLLKTCGEFQFNAVTWSIGAEFVMYLLFPLIAAATLRVRSAPLIVGCLLLIVELALVFPGGVGTTRAWTELHPVLRALPSFLIGVGLAARPVRALPYPGWLLAGSTAGLIAAMWFGAPGIVQLLLVIFVGFSAIEADMAGSAGSLTKRLAPLGQLTYSLYMWHLLAILVLLNMVADKLFHGRPAIVIAMAILCYGGLALWSYISFTFIETPARRWVDGWFKGSRKLHGIDSGS